LATSSAPARMIQLDEFKLPFKHTDGEFSIIRNYYQKVCNQNDPPFPSTIGFGVKSPFLNVFYNHFKNKNFALYFQETSSIVIFNPNLNYIRGLSRENKVITPWSISPSSPAIRIVQIASLKCNQNTVEFDPPIVFQLSFSVLPAITISKTNLQLVKFFNDVFYQESTSSENPLSIQFMFNNTTSILSKTIEPINDIKKSTQNILGINFFKKMTTCFNDHTNNTVSPTITFINF
jgi:hypothetical protein